jgi:hypothetical protein
MTTTKRNTSRRRHPAATATILIARMVTYAFFGTLAVWLFHTGKDAAQVVSVVSTVAVAGSKASRHITDNSAFFE